MNDNFPINRRLCVVLAADAVGYARLMSGDEAGTLAVLNESRAIFQGRIQAHGGRVIDTSGDSVLAEFASPFEAVSAAVEIQQELAARGETLPTERRLLFRIGINLGDVIEDKGAIYGDGVNVAARLQELAEPGGLSISGTVFDQIEGKLPLTFKYIGEQRIRNFSKPVRAYRVQAGNRKRRMCNPQRLAAVAVAACAVSLAIGLLWQSTSPPIPITDPAYAMPTGPVIAVLPFTNLSGDPKQDYYSDGLTEDIITELARFKDLYVLARNTTYEYKGRSINVAVVGKSLGAGYLLEGSVRRSGGQVRITAQLIDVATGAHLWAERYDRRNQDIFLVQSEIADRIVSAISGGSRTVIPRASSDASMRKNPDDIQAYEHVLRASVFFHIWSKENYDLAKTHLERAIKLAPDYARARHLYAYALLIGWIGHFEETPAPPARVIADAVKSVELDPTDYRAHRTAAFGHFFDKKLLLFDRHAARAIELAPNDAEVLAEMGALYTFSGNWDQGVRLSIKANNLNPAAAGGWYHSALHYDFFRKGNYRQALAMASAHPEQKILHTQWKYVAAYAELGEIEKAREHFERCRKIDPTWSADRMGEELRLWNIPEPLVKSYLQSYAKAGYLTVQRL